MSCKILDSQRSVVIECGNDVYAWNGRYSTKEERQSAKQFAQVLILCE